MENTPDTNQVEKKFVKLICPTHGDVTKSVVAISLEDPNQVLAEGETARPAQYLYCLHCINDLLLGLQADGKLPKITVQEVPESTSETEQPKE